MKKKVLSIVLSVAMTAALLAGCGAAAESAAPAAATEEAAPAAEAPAATEEAAPAADAASGDGYHFEVIVKSFQSSYWQAAVKGIDQACAELGVTANCTGPNAESDIADQVNMLNNAINSAPNGIGLAACDAEAVLDSLQTALDKGIPVVCFDAGVPNAPAGSVIATCATDNYAAGSVAAENMYPALKDKIASAGAPVRIGEVNQDATGANIIERGLGFIETFTNLATADGYKVAIIGNEKYVNDASANVTTVAEGEADIIIEVAVPAQTTVELCATEASAIMNKSDLIGIFGSNQVSAEGVLTANDSLQILGTDPANSVLAVGFDAGSVIKGAISGGTMFGAVTQSPLMMGRLCIETLTKACNGESVSDIPTDGYWYDSTNMAADDIAPNLYD